jgi:hypothetical protein
MVSGKGLELKGFDNTYMPQLPELPLVGGHLNQEIHWCPAYFSSSICYDRTPLYLRGNDCYLLSKVQEKVLELTESVSMHLLFCAKQR